MAHRQIFPVATWQARTNMIAVGTDADPCGWDEVYRAYGCAVEFDEELDDDD